MQIYPPPRFVMIDCPHHEDEQERTDPSDLQQVLLFLAELNSGTKRRRTSNSDAYAGPFSEP